MTTMAEMERRIESLEKRVQQLEGEGFELLHVPAYTPPAWITNGGWEPIKGPTYNSGAF